MIHLPIQHLTIGLESDRRSRRLSRKPWSSTSWALISCSFATHTAAVFLTYGSSSFRHFRRGSHRYSVILSTRMQPIVRTANERIKGFGSSQSFNTPTTLLLPVQSDTNKGAFTIDWLINCLGFMPYQN